MNAKPAPLLPYIVGWLVLLLLLGLNVLSGYLPLGNFHALASFGISATQAAIVFTIFMGLRGRPGLSWVFAGAGFFWLAFLYGLSATDYATRAGFPAQ
jgi:cytochrome c oxidase subunit 4